MTTRRLAVADPRNSECGSCRLSRLDFSRWFSDGLGNTLYLHVAGPDDTWHRVWCRKSDEPRLRSERGKMWWLVEGGKR